MDLYLGTGTAVITICGELDIAVLADAQILLERALAENPTLLVFDLRGVTFLDSAGLTLLVRANRRMRNLDGHVVIANASPRVVEVFVRTELDRQIHLHETALDVEAVRALR